MTPDTAAASVMKPEPEPELDCTALRWFGLLCLQSNERGCFIVATYLPVYSSPHCAAPRRAFGSPAHPPNAQDHLVALLRPLRVEQLLLRVLRCDTVGPYRLPRDAVCAIDEALARIAVTIGEGDGDGEARGPGARLLGEVPSLHAVTVEVGRREVRWTRGARTGAGASLGRPC